MSISFTLTLSFFYFIGSHTSRVLITLDALKLGASPLAVAFIAGIFSVLPALLSWPAGRFADRYGSRWPLLLGTAGGALGLLLSYLIPGIPTLFATSLMAGSMTALFAAPLQNLVGLQSAPGDRTKNFSNLSLLFSFGSFSGPLLAGFSIDHIGAGRGFLALALLLLTLTAILAFRGRLLPGGAGKAQPGQSARLLLSEPGLWRPLASSSLVVLGLELFQVFLPIYGNGVGLSASAIGIVLSLYSVAAFLVRVVLPELVNRFTADRVLAYSFLIGAGGFFLVPFFQSMVMLSLVSFFFGIGMGCGQPLTLMMTYSSSSQGRSGEAMGLRLTVNYLTRVVGQLLFGAIGSAFGLFPVFLGNALLLASGWVASHPHRPRRRRRNS